MNHGTRATFTDGCRCAECDAIVPHGTPYGYVTFRCRCRDCTRNNATRWQKYKVRVMRGEPIWGDIDAVKQRIWQLLADGHSMSEIASAAGYKNKGSVRDLLQVKRITVASANRILNVDLTRADRNILIPSLGTMRRLRALARAGYPTNLIADLIGFDVATLQKIVRGEQRRVRRWVAEAVTRFYAHNHMRPGPSTDTANRAAALGWHPPLAWDDDDFDDPRGQARARTRIKR